MKKDQPAVKAEVVKLEVRETFFRWFETCADARKWMKQRQDVGDGAARLSKIHGCIVVRQKNNRGVEG